MNKITPKRDEIVRRRNQLGLTQHDLAAFAGCQDSYITRIEKGSAKSPSLEVIANIAIMLKCSPKDIADGVSEVVAENFSRAGCKTLAPDDAYAQLTKWLSRSKDTRNVLVLAMRCGWKGVDPLGSWLRSTASEADREDVFAAASQAGYKGND